jgi:hypothetical protein
VTALGPAVAPLRQTVTALGQTVGNTVAPLGSVVTALGPAVAPLGSVVTPGAQAAVAVAPTTQALASVSQGPGGLTNAGSGSGLAGVARSAASAVQAAIGSPALPRRLGLYAELKSMLGALSAQYAAVNALAFPSSRVADVGQPRLAGAGPLPGPMAPAPSAPAAPAGAGGIASGFFFMVGSLMALLVLVVPRLSVRARPIGQSGAPSPLILLLDRPG